MIYNDVWQTSGQPQDVESFNTLQAKGDASVRDSWGISPVAGGETPKVSTVYAVEPIKYSDLPVDATSIAEQQLSGYMPKSFRNSGFERVLLHGDAAHKIVDFRALRPFQPVWTGAHMEHTPNPENLEFRNVVCAIDLGKQSCQALRWAGLFAHEFGAWEKIQGLPRSLGLDATISVIPDEATACWDGCARTPIRSFANRHARLLVFNGDMHETP